MSVSRALRNQPGVSEKTRRRILAIAEDLDYEPNPLISVLMSHVATSRPIRSRPMLVYVIADTAKRNLKEIMWGRDGVSSYIGACNRAMQQGYAMEMLQVGHEEMTTERFNSILEARGVAGLIISPMMDRSIRIKLNWNVFSSVAIGYSMNEPDLHRVCLDYYNAMYKGLERLWQQGFRSFGFYLLSSIDQRIRHLWVSAFLTFHWTKGIPVEGRIQTPDDHFSRKEFIRWFKHCKPDAIFSLHDTALAQWYPEVVRMSDRPCGFFHLTLDFAQSDIVDGGFPGCKMELGAVAVDLLIAQIKRGEKGIPSVPQISLIEPKLTFPEDLQSGAASS